MVIEPSMGAIDAKIESVRYRAQLIARNQKLDSGVSATGVLGFAVGFIFAILMVLILPLLVWGVM